jgi:hypothetical protein
MGMKSGTGKQTEQSLLFTEHITAGYPNPIGLCAQSSQHFFSCSQLVKDDIIKSLNGTVSRDFLLLVLFMNQFPPSPRVFH